MEQSSRCETIAQAPYQIVGTRPLHRADRGGVPFRRLIVVDRHEGRLAAHGQTHVVRHQVDVDFLAERIERGPRLFGERSSHARLFGNPLDAHIVRERDLTWFNKTADRGSRAKVRRRGDREVALPAQKSGRRVEPDPARAGQVDLGPSMQVAEVELSTGGAFERFYVRPELDEIAGHEAGWQVDVPQDLHQQPRRVAAGAGT